jgi:3',5'-cyclic AMP phosphodiesterase CpdA
MTTREHQRLQEIHDDVTSWRRWGPYVSDRSWATVREDYSSDGNAWDYLPHDLARSKAYRWGEDGIAGICDRYQFLCFAPAFWNGRDPILKERFFGLTPHQGNHGEDVKEYYFYLDNLPSHAYMRFLYKYPQAAFPYERLARENQRRLGQGDEFELLDTGIFDDDRYFDIFIEYAKATPEDLCIRIEAFNRGPEPALLHILPHLWFRNIWGWNCDAWTQKNAREPIIRPGASGAGFVSVIADDSGLSPPRSIRADYRLGRRILSGPNSAALLFTDNETNSPRVFGKEAMTRKPYVKDAFHRHLIDGEACLNPAKEGTKAALHYVFPAVPSGGSVSLCLRLSDAADVRPLSEVEEVIALRRAEADEFYEAIQPPRASDDEKRTQRQAFAGLLWTKQSYLFDVHQWLEGDCALWKPPPSRQYLRNVHWRHLNSHRIMSMPDKWEYPWFAAWDLAFHAVTFAVVDPSFAKEQLWMMLFEQFQHPNGQIPAYEWEFSDLNPPVHAWAVWRVYNMDRIRQGTPDRPFLERCFHKLLINFAWWINKVDREGNNIFEGGFLGLDNITVVDRSMDLGHGVVLEQADATGWMGLFCLQMMRIALELAKENEIYESLATKFFQHYTYVAKAMKSMGGRGYELWNDKDGFFYDVLRYPNGDFNMFRVRSMVGLIPLFAVERLESDWIAPFKEFTSSFHWFLNNRPDLVKDVVHQSHHGGKLTHVLTIVDNHQLTRMLQRMWDESEFLSPHGIRSLSKVHESEPFWFHDSVVTYEPAEAISKIKGGNSNWRGPIWFPTCFLLIEALRKLGTAYGPLFTVRTPGNKNEPLAFQEMAGQLADRLIGLFTRDTAGRRPVHAERRKFQDDPHWRDLLLFYEYFHGDTGAGLGASHQTGWTALVASLIDEWRR